MARGIQPGPEQLLEEAHVEAVAVLYDAVERDVVELSDLRTLLDDLHRGLADASSEAKGIVHFEEATRIVTRLITDDRTENQRHRTAIRLLVSGDPR